MQEIIVHLTELFTICKNRQQCKTSLEKQKTLNSSKKNHLRYGYIQLIILSVTSRLLQNLHVLVAVLEE